MKRPRAAAAGVLLDLLAGEPPYPVHPVALFGNAMKTVEGFAYRDSRRAGSFHAAIGVGLGAAAGRFVNSTSAATFAAVAGRGLMQAATVVDDALARNDLAAARGALPALVGRDPQSLGEPEIVRAVVESVAENTVDAVVAPAFWGAVAGAPGASAYRAVNTMDSMVGHRSPRYARYGTASARLDDFAGWLPARLTAGLVALVRPRRAACIRLAVTRDAPAHPSPNAGVAEAAFAAALALKLGGELAYEGRPERRPALGSGRAPVRADIRRANRLCRDVALALSGVLWLAGRT